MKKVYNSLFKPKPQVPCFVLDYSNQLHSVNPSPFCCVCKGMNRISIFRGVAWKEGGGGGHWGDLFQGVAAFT